MTDNVRRFRWQKAGEASAPDLLRECGQKLTDRALWAKIEALTRTQLDKALGGRLVPGQIDAILARRDQMRTDINSLTR